jgi:3-keto-disaccharide hydrolase
MFSLSSGRSVASVLKSVPFVLFVCVASSAAQQTTATPPQTPPPAPTGYKDTPKQAKGNWLIHDDDRPRPVVVKPGPFVGLPAPADAIVLLGAGQDLSKWQMQEGGGPVTWPIADGVLSSGKGFIRTKQDDFTDYQLHVEFATPSAVKGDSQGRGNSGVFLNGVFEIQVLDSYNNKSYADGQASAMYGQIPPMVNAARPPGEWQSYDIIFRGPKFDGTTLKTPAIVTVLHNGVAVHASDQFWGPTAHKLNPPYAPTNAKGPIGLQDHGNPVRFRNIWIRPLKDAE